MLYQFQAYCKVNYLYIYIYPFFFRFLSHIGHYQVLSRVPWAMQQVLIRYLFYIEYCVSTPIFQFVPPLPQKFTHFNLGYKVLYTQNPPTIPVLPDPLLSWVYHTVTKWQSHCLSNPWNLLGVLYVYPLDGKFFSQSHLSDFKFHITPQKVLPSHYLQ